MISRFFKAGHSARLEVAQLYPNIRLNRSRVVPTWCRNEPLTGVATLGIGYYDRAETSVNDEWLFPHEVSTGAARGCHCCPSSSPPIPVYHDSRRRILGPVYLFFEFSGQSRVGLLPVSGCGDGLCRLFARLYLPPPGNTVEHPDPGCANRTAEGYLRPPATVCARRRTISCIRRHSASSRASRDTTATAYTNVELPSADPHAR